MPLPIEEVLPELQAALSGAQTVVLEAPPGAGKTTRVPLALLHQPWLEKQSILMLEPRRLAARNAALRMAHSLGEHAGDTVGYRVRFAHRVSRHTRIEVLTEGILSRRLQHDPALEGVGLVIFDEFHERSLHADLGLALCRDVQAALRPELRLLLMSATLDSDTLAQHLGDVPQVRSAGRPYPVTIEYQPPGRQDWLSHLVQTLRRIQPQTTGDILVFLPGRGEIRRVHEALGHLPGTRILHLYGEQALSEQQAAMTPDPEGLQRLILATPIAETSLTIEGVTTVVDSGFGRSPQFQPRLGMTRLQTQRISQDAADQRAGRAGRLGAGHCLRLWPKEETLAPQRQPEILAADLAPLALELAHWGADAAQLAWLDPPPPAALQQAQDLLRQLQALDDKGRITATGQAMAQLPGHPRLAHMLLRAQALGLEALGGDLAALLEARDPLRRGAADSTDIHRRLALLDADTGHRADTQQLRKASAQWRKALAQVAPTSPVSPWQGHPHDAPGLLLALAYPDRIAQRRGANRYKLSHGRGARLAADDPLGTHEWIVAAHVDAGTQEAKIFLAAGVQVDDLRRELASQLVHQQQIFWEPRSRSVVARQVCLLGALALESQDLPNPDPEHLRQALLQGIQQAGLNCLPWTDTLRQWQARVQSLRHWCPDMPWPAVDDSHLSSTLADWLGPYLSGMRRLEALQNLDLGGALQSLLPWPLPRELDTLAPRQLSIPSGSKITLRYRSDGQVPILAARLQELFGLHDTPRIAGGRVAVLVEILSPARRPLQLTGDLASFWSQTYAEVRREMRGRYPKHYWPENPFEAQAIQGVRPRK